MAYADALTALADPTRRSIFEALRERPKHVGELAAVAPVSRPAVSQHLKVLVSANIVGVEAAGTRRVYFIKPDGLEELRAYLEGFWSDVLSAYGNAVVQRKARKRRG